NWLYSTIAQSSAAIVAIIGGFMTATILRLTAEKRSLVKRLEWLNSYTKSSLAPITENIEELKREIPTLEARIKTFSYPPNLKWGVAVLGVNGETRNRRRDSDELVPLLLFMLSRIVIKFWIEYPVFQSKGNFL
ncbi:unnamed protein product, partial [marine sediment metagenome]